MKIRIKIILASIIVFFISNSLYAQYDSSRADSNKITFDPQFSGAYFEACVKPFGLEVDGMYLI